MVFKKILKGILYILGILSIASFGDTLRSVIPFLEKILILFDNYIKPAIVKFADIFNLSIGYSYYVFSGLCIVTIFLVPVMIYHTPKAAKELDKWQPRFVSITMLLIISIIPIAFSIWPLIIIARILIHVEHYFDKESHQKNAIEATTSIIALLAFIIAAIIEFLI